MDSILVWVIYIAVLATVGAYIALVVVGLWLAIKNVLRRR